MKKIYIKPFITGITTMSEDILEGDLKHASYSSSPVPGPIETDDTEGEVDADAKGFNSWTVWDEE